MKSHICLVKDSTFLRKIRRFEELIRPFSFKILALAETSYFVLGNSYYWFS